MKYLLSILLLIPFVVRGQIIPLDGPTYQWIKNNTGDSLDALRDSAIIKTVTITDESALLLSGDATVWNDLVFQATTLKTVGQADKPDFIAANVTLSFPEDTTEMVGIIAQMPHSWKPGSTVYPHVHWRQAADNAVDWKISYKWWNIGDAEPVNYIQTTIATTTQDYTSGTIHQLSTNASGISGSGKGVSSILVIKLYRKSDNYTGEAQLLQFDIHYEISGIGSNNEDGH